MTDKEKPRNKDEIDDEKLEEVSGGKLTVGDPKDSSEREADAVAESVMRGDTPKTSSP